MNEAGPVASDSSTGEGRRAARPVFVSYATSDRKQALALCKALERRGTKCWISSRDVEPGENYQEAIVRAIRQAPAMVLVFSDAANNSDEIKKELSLVSRHRIPVMAVRIEDVEPSDAFAYELSTRQWIDAFEGWDKSIDSLSRRLARISGDRPTSAEPHVQGPRQAKRPASRRAQLGMAAVLALVLAAGLAAWLMLRPADAAAHSMQVRLTGFQRLSPDLPEAVGQALGEEFIAAFSEDGVVTASTAPAPPPGNSPAYALGGTLRRDGDKIKLIARLTNERSGATLWSNSFTYDSKAVSRLPRVAAADASGVVRCGLFGASTHATLLPDPVLTDYLSFCTQTQTGPGEPSKALDFARKVVAAQPDFSAGWSAITIAAGGASRRMPPGHGRAALEKEALAAADRAIKLDARNSEAYAYKSVRIDRRDLAGREALLRQALEARPLACGCEHHFYGAMLAEAGRTGAALAEYRRAVDVLALNISTQIAYAESLLAAGQTWESKQHFDAAMDLVPNPAGLDEEIAVMTAPLTRDYARARKIIETTREPVPPPVRAAGLKALAALESGDPAAKAAAARELAALPLPMGQLSARYLGALGANRLALAKVEQVERSGRSGARMWLFEPTMAGARSDPAFAGVAERLGLIAYWRKTRTKPDFCSAANAPPVCRSI